TLALSYGARDEITRAIKRIVNDVTSKKISLDKIDESLISNYLDTAGMPDPDLWIRTSGEMRLSNFLLWQISYSELYMTSTLWPDFNRRELDLALADFQTRNRRFGKIS
ncbi:MAG: di-trans,poly-cis-decaprenylcistransferase, partial [Methylococcaceae bacterium]|nr:di-trans,poly-cis-decaprenylcistransferase [Methylococcaceae bacterium]